MMIMWVLGFHFQQRQSQPPGRSLSESVLASLHHSAGQEALEDLLCPASAIVFS